MNMKQIVRMRKSIIQVQKGVSHWLVWRDHRPDDKRVYPSMEFYGLNYKDMLENRPLTPAETAAHLLGAPASSFPVEAPKDEELPS